LRFRVVVMRVLIAGITGQVGGAVATALAQLPDIGVRGLVRSPAKVPSDASYEAVVGDLGDLDSLMDAVQGCEAVFIASSIDRDQVRLQTNLVHAAAVSSERPRIVKLSGLGTALDSFVDSGRWHAEIEQAIQQTELPAASLRPLFFVQNLRLPLRRAKETGILEGQAAVEIAMLDVADLAAVAAALLANDRLEGFNIFTPTGSRTYTFSDVADTMSHVLGRPVRFEATSDVQTTASLQQAGMPAWHIDIMLQFRKAFSEGWGTPATSAVEDILGRPPIDLASSLRSLM